MNTSYTIIISLKRPAVRIIEHRTIELWDIIHKEDFNHPKLMRRYLQGMGILFTGYPPNNSIRIELHQGTRQTMDVSHKPMIIRRAILPGKTIFRPCVHYPNGNVQDLRDFLNHWRDMIDALELDYSRTRIPLPTGRAA